MAERRKKEFGIRKVLGATSIWLLKDFSFKYTMWVIWANIIAFPVAYYVMNNGFRILHTELKSTGGFLFYPAESLCLLRWQQ